jgi:NDP-sugar pyrophosphorylase family protein
MTTQAVILAGGKGTRLAPYTATIPKPLIPIDTYPILEIILRQLKYYGIKDITLTLGHMAHLIESYFGNGKRFGLKIRTSVEKKPLGTAGPLSLLKNISDTVVVLNGDLFTTMNFRRMITFHNRHRADATIGLYRQATRQQSGVITTDKESRITSYVEKPTTFANISMGIYIFSKKAIQMIPKNTHFDLPELINKLITAKKRIYGFQNTAEWLDIGRPEDYAKAIELFQISPGRYLKQ